MARLSFTMPVLAILVSSIVRVAASAADTVTAICGTATYDPSQFACFDDGFLCPIVGQDINLKCGEACYSVSQFGCSNTTLVPIAQIGPGTLLACDDQQFDPSQYVCYDGEFLCPFVCRDGLRSCLTGVSNRNPTLRCGDACYDPAKFSCTNDTLASLPAPDCVGLDGSNEEGSCCPGLLSIASKCRDFCDFEPSACTPVPG
ncbi:carbohydrate binding-domain-containing protein [Mycena pura]|uniref:Carbohydrate binding-domain-containing protein n=1 Tax=Mycena pura TaxID=153505 RepID=A0AAD6UUH7_9AGAR|nr:carbohydrate binding-domain-containing protein [Mycena pura]